MVTLAFLIAADRFFPAINGLALALRIIDLVLDGANFTLEDFLFALVTLEVEGDALKVDFVLFLEEADVDCLVFLADGLLTIV